MNLLDISSIGLELAVVALGLLVLLADAFSPTLTARQLGLATAVGLAGLLGVSFFYAPLSGPTFYGMYRVDALALFFKRFFLVAGLLVSVMSVDFLEPLKRGAGGFFAVALFALTGMMLCASANDFVMLFVSVELITVSFYVLVSFLRAQQPSIEAGTKYLIIGALSSGFMMYGIAFIFGTTGATNFDAVAAKLAELRGVPGAALLLGMLLVLVGLGFKIACAPFQIWAPDVYQGAPSPVTAFLAVGSKAAGFVLLLRVLFGAWQPAYANGGKLALLVGSLAGLTLLYGNLAAIPQRNIKRLLGYSSIGHAGYMLMGLAAVNEIGVSAVLYYLSAYLFTTLCAFMVIVAFSSATGSDDIPSYSGLAKRSPILALAMLLAMLSLAGIPPLAGFIGKFLLFTAVVDAARTQPQLYVLAFIGIAMAVVSLYFYLGVAKAMYLQEPDDETPIPVSLPMRAALYVAMGGIFVLGMFQRPVMDWAQHAAAVLGVR